MEHKINELAQSVKALTEMFNVLQQNVQFTVNVILAVLGIAITIAGASLVVLAKYWVNKRVDEELSKIDERIKRTIEDNPQFYWATVKAPPVNNEIMITGLIGQETLTLDFPTKISVLDKFGIERDFQSFFNDKGALVIRLKHFDPRVDGNEVTVNILWLRKIRQ